MADRFTDAFDASDAGLAAAGATDQALARTYLTYLSLPPGTGQSRRGGSRNGTCRVARMAATPAQEIAAGYQRTAKLRDERRRNRRRAVALLHFANRLMLTVLVLDLLLTASDGPALAVIAAVNAAAFALWATARLWAVSITRQTGGRG